MYYTIQYYKVYKHISRSLLRWGLAPLQEFTYESSNVQSKPTQKSFFCLQERTCLTAATERLRHPSWPSSLRGVAELTADEIREILEENHLKRGMALWRLNRVPDSDEVRSVAPSLRRWCTNQSLCTGALSS